VDTDSCDHVNTTFLELAQDFYKVPTEVVPLRKQGIGSLEPDLIAPNLLNVIGDGNAEGEAEAMLGRTPSFYRHAKAQVEILPLGAGPVPTSSTTAGRLAVR